MKRITRDELEVFLRKHKLWLADDPEGERANLWGANLRGANLRGANNLSLPIACPEEGSFIGFKRCQGNLDELN